MTWLRLCSVLKQKPYSRSRFYPWSYWFVHVLSDLQLLSVFNRHFPVHNLLLPPPPPPPPATPIRHTHTHMVHHESYRMSHILKTCVACIQHGVCVSCTHARTHTRTHARTHTHTHTSNVSHVYNTWTCGWHTVLGVGGYPALTCIGHNVRYNRAVHWVYVSVCPFPILPLWNKAPLDLNRRAASPTPISQRQGEMPGKL